MADPLSKNIDTMAGLTGILTTLLGKKGGTESTTTSGGTETKQTQLDVGAMMKQLLEGAGTAGYGKAGLAANLTAGKRAGVYGGKSTELNLNDLLSRITAEASIAGAPTTINKQPTTTTRSGVGSQAGMVGGGGAGLGALALLAGSKSGKKAIKDMWDSLGTSNIPSEPLGGSFGDSGMLGSAADWGLPDSAAGAGNTASFGNADMLGTSADWGFDAVDSFSSFGDAGSFGDADILGSSADWGFDAAGSAGDATGTPIGAGLKVLSGDVQGGVESGIGYFAGSAIGGPIGGAIGSAIAEPVFEAASDILQAAGDIVDDCFITTAICTIQGKPDDCAELTVLRQYRDSWLKSNHPEDIQEYYAVAPAIVQAIQKREDSAVIWNELYRHYLVPAIEAIENGNAALAHTVYRNMVNTAKELANG
jgi:hypothetical protein